LADVQPDQIRPSVRAELIFREKSFRLSLMSSLQEIQSAIQKLPKAEYQELHRWWESYDEQLWDAKLAQDSKPGGRLQEILREVDADIDAGRLTAFPK
jgi:hypothetical protein